MTKLVSDSRLDELCAGWGKDGEIGMLTPLGNEIRDCLLELRELRRLVAPACNNEALEPDFELSRKIDDGKTVLLSKPCPFCHGRFHGVVAWAPQNRSGDA